MQLRLRPLRVVGVDECRGLRFPRKARRVPFNVYRNKAARQNLRTKPARHTRKAHLDLFDVQWSFARIPDLKCMRHAFALLHHSEIVVGRCDRAALRVAGTADEHEPSDDEKSSHKSKRSEAAATASLRISPQDGFLLEIETELSKAKTLVVVAPEPFLEITGEQCRAYCFARITRESESVVHCARNIQRRQVFGHILPSGFVAFGAIWTRYDNSRGTDDCGRIGSQITSAGFHCGLSARLAQCSRPNGVRSLLCFRNVTWNDCDVLVGGDVGGAGQLEHRPIGRLRVAIAVYGCIEAIAIAHLEILARN